MSKTLDELQSTMGLPNTLVNQLSEALSAHRTVKDRFQNQNGTPSKDWENWHGLSVGALDKQLNRHVALSAQRRPHERGKPQL